MVSIGLFVKYKKLIRNDELLIVHLKRESSNFLKEDISSIY